MDSAFSTFRRGGRGRGGGGHEINGRGGRPQSKNKSWVAGGGSSGSNTPRGGSANDGRWERGGHRASARGRGNGNGNGRTFHSAPLLANHEPTFDNMTSDEEGGGGEHEEQYQDDYQEDYQEEDEGIEEDQLDEEIEEPTLDDPAEREKFYQELVKAREIERKKAIAEGKMDDPLIPKRLEDAITMVGTCMDMAPRFERYRRERENNLFEWETIPGTKRINHKRAVKMYERAAGDKTLPSDLRPPIVLKKTLDYLFHDLLPRGGFSQTFNFIRDRSRAVRNDFTMQHNTGPLAIECHDRCARFHIVALHSERERTGFSVALEEQQLMNTLQSLKEFYEDQRGRYESPTELEMRVYHRLIHIRDQKERHEDIPSHITSHPVFKLTTRFRQHVQSKSAPISKASKLIVDEQGMQIFGELAVVLREQGSTVMVYLVACILERLFGPDTIEDIESIRGDLSIPDIIDGVTTGYEGDGQGEEEEEENYEQTDEGETWPVEPEVDPAVMNGMSAPVKPSPTEWLTNNFGANPTPSAFFGATSSKSAPFNSFAQPAPAPATSAFSNLSSVPNAFGNVSVFGAPKIDAPISKFGNAPATGAEPSATGSNTFSSTPAFGDSPFGTTSSAQSLFGKPSSTSPFAPQTGAPAPQNGSNISNGSPSTFGQKSTAPPLGPIPIAPTFTRPDKGASETVRLPPPNIALNPTAPTLTPLFKPTPSPLRQDSTDATVGIPNDAFSSPSRSPRHNLFGTPSALSSPNPSPFPNGEQSAGSEKANNFSPFGKSPSTTMFPASNTPPLRPRINTTPTDSPTSLQLPRTPLDEPPPLNKQQPISLPSTPTAAAPTTPSLSSPGPKRTKSILDSLKGSLQTGVSASSEVLSPLVLSSPSISRTVHNFANGGTPSASPSSARKTSLDKSTSIGGSQKTDRKLYKDDVDVQALAFEFSRKGALVKYCFRRWRTQMAAKIAWNEACRRSDAYSQKVQRERASDSPLAEKKRRLTANMLISDSPQRKRARKRVSGEYKKPHTDEELAQRFKANHEEHERRWAQGSFLQCIRKCVKRMSGSYPPAWHIWLSTNPETDGTAIWLEKKFDVPASGQWNSEHIFSIPIDPSGESSLVSPGVIIFECTPLEGVADDIERKYRVLDDCSRLRDIVNALPAGRHFVPSLLVITWIDAHVGNILSEFTTMASQFIQDGILGGHQTFSISSETRDLDIKLDQAVSALGLDLEGQLVHHLSIPAIFQAFRSIWSDFIFEWIDSCLNSGDFDYLLYSKVLDSAVRLLNMVASSTFELLGGRPTEPLPLFPAEDLLDSDMTYDTVILWLETPAIQDVASVLSKDLQSQQSTERDFPVDSFLDHLFSLTLRLVERHASSNSHSHFYLLKVQLASAVRSVKGAVDSYASELRKVFALRSRRSPKRALSVDESEPSRFSTPSKRRRISTSNPSTPSDGASQTSSPPNTYRSSPSPTASVSTAPANGDSPTITVAMLRALTKDVKAKYVASPLTKE